MTKTKKPAAPAVKKEKAVKVVAPVKPPAAPKAKARTANARTAPEIKTTANGQKYIERKLIKAPAQGKAKGKK